MRLVAVTANCASRRANGAGSELIAMSNAVKPPWRPPSEPPDLICPHCATDKEVILVKDAIADAALWPLWCARCGHEWTIPKPRRG